MEPILALHSITKKYSGVTALSDVSIQFQPGKIHSVVGENGAGKSTLLQIITGAVSQNEGTIYFKNENMGHLTPIKSKGLGITAVYQELNLIPELKVYENIFYGKELKKSLVLDEAEMKKQASSILKTLNSTLDINEPVRNLGIGSCQIIEIAKALTSDIHLILFDEPTAALPQKEAEHLHEIIQELAKKQIAVVFISHKLDEVLKISDTITVLRDGHHIDTRHRNGSWAGIYDIPTLVNQMLGKTVASLSDSFQPDMENTPPVLRLENLNTSKVHNISFSLHKGEILSISGLLGSKRTEVLSAIFALDKVHSGSIYIHGKKTTISSPKDAISAKIGYITEDRKSEGLFMELSIRENMSIASLSQLTKGLSIDRVQEDRRIKEILSQLNVKYHTLDQKVKELSGGNQQKVAIGKWLMANPDIILLDEPTRGVDVGAKEEIYKIILTLAQSGKSILMVSSETEEILRLSHRTLVMNNGKIVSEYAHEEISPEKILQDSSKFINGV